MWSIFSSCGYFAISHWSCDAENGANDCQLLGGNWASSSLTIGSILSGTIEIMQFVVRFIIISLGIGVGEKNS